MLSKVVLPAPLGPITERISPGCTPNPTRDTAWTPPNDRDTSRISSCGPLMRRRSREPPLPPAVVLHVPVALALADAGETQVELLDVLVLADRLAVPVEHDPAVLHHVGVVGEAERHRRVLLGEQHGDALLAVQPAHDLEDLLDQ